MKPGKYIIGSDALAFVKEEMLHIFKSSAVLTEEKSAPEHHGWFMLVFRYIPKSYMIYFEGEFSYFIVRIEKGDGAFTTLNRLTDFDNTLRMSAVRESVKKLKEILEREILFIYKA